MGKRIEQYFQHRRVEELPGLRIREELGAEICSVVPRGGGRALDDLVRILA